MGAGIGEPNAWLGGRAEAGVGVIGWVVGRAAQPVSSLPKHSIWSNSL